MQRTISSYYFIYFVALASSSPFLSLYLSNRGMDTVHIGLLLAAGAVAGILAQPIIGFMNDRTHDSRRILCASAILTPIVYAGYAVFHGFWPLLVVAVVLAVVQSSSPIMDAIAIKEGERFGFTYGEIRLWGALGWALTTMVAGYAYNLVGFGVSFIVFAALSVFIVLVTLFLPRAESAIQAREPILQGIWNVARHPALLWFLSICFLLSTAGAVNGSFLPLYYEHLHYPMGWLGMNYTVAALVEVPFFYISGKVIERFGLMRVLVAGSVLYAAKYAVMALAPGAVVVISVQVLEGVAYALYLSASVQLVSDLAPAGRSATAQTLYASIAGSLSSIVGSTVGGWVFDTFGPLSMYRCLTVVTLVAVVGFLLFAKFHVHSQKHHISSHAEDVYTPFNQ